MTESPGRRRPGFLVTFEGVDGAGKSTQVALLASHLRSRGTEVVSVREPGDTTLGELARSFVLQHPAGQPLDAWAEALLFVAARAQLLSETILPALARDAVVVCDRFVDSTLAYQGFGRGLPVDALRRLHADACGDVWPDLTVLLELPEADAAERRHAAELPLDRMEMAPADFHAAVAAGFAAIAGAEPARVARVDATGSPSAVSGAVWEAVAPRLGLAVPA